MQSMELLEEYRSQGKSKYHLARRCCTDIFFPLAVLLSLCFSIYTVHKVNIIYEQIGEQQKNMLDKISICLASAGNAQPLTSLEKAPVECEDITSVRNDIQSLNSSIKSFQFTLDTLDTDFKLFQTNMSQTLSQVLDLTNRVDTKVNKTAENTNKIRDITSSLTSHADYHSMKFREIIESHSNSTSQLNSSVNSRYDDIEQLFKNGDIQSLQSSMESFEVVLGKVETDFKTFQIDMNHTLGQTLNLTVRVDTSLNKTMKNIDEIKDISSRLTDRADNHSLKINELFLSLQDFHADVIDSHLNLTSHFNNSARKSDAKASAMFRILSLFNNIFKYIETQLTQSRIATQQIDQSLKEAINTNKQGFETLSNMTKQQSEDFTNFASSLDLHASSLRDLHLHLNNTYADFIDSHRNTSASVKSLKHSIKNKRSVLELYFFELSHQLERQQDLLTQLKSGISVETGIIQQQISCVSKTSNYFLTTVIDTIEDVGYMISSPNGISTDGNSGVKRMLQNSHKTQNSTKTLLSSSFQDTKKLNEFPSEKKANWKWKYFKDNIKGQVQALDPLRYHLNLSSVACKKKQNMSGGCLGLDFCTVNPEIQKERMISQGKIQCDDCWFYFETGDGSGLVLTINSTGRESRAGDRLIVDTKRGTDNQKWRIDESHIFFNKKDNLVVDIHGGNKKPNATIIVWSRIGQPNQQWYYQDGYIYSKMHNQVMDWRYSTGGVVTMGVDSGGTQTWTRKVAS